MVAVDPTDPRHLIAVAMGNLHLINGKPTTGNEVHHGVANSTINWLGVSHDAGVTWSVGEQPILSGKWTRCPDAFADVLKDGTFIAGCEPRETASGPDYFGMSAFQISRDHGQTWGPVVQMISDYQLDRFAQGLKPVSGGSPPKDPNRVASNSPWDRPYTHIDDSTGVIYGVAQGGSAWVDEAAATRRSQAYVTASADGGKRFGPVYAWDSPEFPQVSRGISASAAHGVLAVTYIAGRAPSTEGATCPCAVLGLSRDQGRTFSYRVLKNIPIAAPASPAAPVPSAGTGQAGRGRGRGGVGNGGLTAISLDPTTPGRLALLQSAGPTYLSSTSTDNGRTWTPFVAAGTVPGATGVSKPRFEFSRDGVLGLMWRASYADGSYDIWASISRDGGRTFSRSLPISHAKSPGRNPLLNGGGFGDDIQDLSMDRTTMHLVWADSRTGFQGVWYGRIALAAFDAAGSAATPAQPRTFPKHVLAWADVRNGYQHDSISHALATIERLGRESGEFDTTIRTDSQPITKQSITFKTGTGIATGEQFLARNLNYYDAIFFFGVREIDLTAEQKADLMSFVRDDGKGFVAAHSAATSFYSWPEFGEMLGGRFDEHPWQVASAPVIVEDAEFPATRGFPSGTAVRDEHYQLKDFSRASVRVLARLDATALDLKAPLVHRTDADFPVAWARMHGRGRVFYSTLGHAPESWDDPVIQNMYLQALRWALRLVEGDATPRPGR